MKYWIKRQFRRIHTWWKRYPKAPRREPTVTIDRLNYALKQAYPAHRIAELAAKRHPLFEVKYELKCDHPGYNGVFTLPEDQDGQ